VIHLGNSDGETSSLGGKLKTSKRPEGDGIHEHQSATYVTKTKDGVESRFFQEKGIAGKGDPSGLGCTWHSPMAKRHQAEEAIEAKRNKYLGRVPTPKR